MMATTTSTEPPTTDPGKSGHRTRNGLLAIAGIGVVVALAAAWWLGLLTPEPEAVTLDAAVETLQAEAADEAPPPVTPVSTATVAPVTEDPTEPEDPTELEPASEPEPAPAAAPQQAVGLALEGSWVVVESDATFAGYRADSQVGEAVGRTPGLTGTITATADQIVAVEMTVDMTTLTSDSSLRDEHLGDEGIEYDTYPTSTFVLSTPIDIGSIPAEGVAVSFEAVGDLTVRAITQPVVIAFDGTIIGDQLLVVGSAEIDLNAYGATVSSTDEAIMEFSVVLRPAA